MPLHQNRLGPKGPLCALRFTNLYSFEHLIESSLRVEDGFVGPDEFKEECGTVVGDNGAQQAVILLRTGLGERVGVGTGYLDARDFEVVTLGRLDLGLGCAAVLGLELVFPAIDVGLHAASPAAER
jgi:hypothetical protein